MSPETRAIVNKVWNFCNLLRDEGLSYGDYVEQLTYLIFLKMAYEQTLPPLNKENKIPNGYDWTSLVSKSGDALEMHYKHTLETLSKQPGMLGDIFRKSTNKIQNPALLERLVKLINEEVWLRLGVDVKGDIYEGLLEKNAQDTKSGAGQYFTPRSVIQAMVEVMKPAPGETICDPACGTGGFFLGAYDYITKKGGYILDRDQQRFLQEQTFTGWELVDNTARLCIMNLYLHGIGIERTPVKVADSLISLPSDRFDMVLTNPPFGKKSSIKIINEDGKEDKDSVTYERDDFWASTTNKQLNFVQHIKSMLKINGRAAVVVPDNVLFEGGAGETIRRKLLEECDVHTLLRLPTGIFYAQGVKANVLFFDRKEGREEPWTKQLWIYDLRTNKHFTLKQNPLSSADFEDFIACYHPENRFGGRTETERFKCFDYDELIQRDKVNLDIFWLKDESLEDTANLPAPEVLAQEIVENLQNALEQFSSIVEELGE
jgi:type I restriction enzyme M protein